MKSQRVIIQNKNKEKLVGYLYKGSSKTIIIACHGIESSNNCFDEETRKLIPPYFSDISKRSRASVFSFDFSGYGESEGEYFLSLRKRDSDIKSVIDYFSSEYDKIVLYGFSLGGLSGTLAALHYKEISGLITVNSFFTMEPENLFMNNVLIILSYLFFKPRFVLELLYRKTELKIKNIMVPTLVVYADNDKFVNPKQSKAFFNRLRTRKKTLLFQPMITGLRRKIY